MGKTYKDSERRGYDKRSQDQKREQDRKRKQMNCDDSFFSGKNKGKRDDYDNDYEN